MIRINLIQAPARETVTKVAPQQGFRDRKEFFPLLAFVVCFGIVGALYWGWNHRIATLNQQLTAERQEAVRLAAIEAQNKQYESQLAEIDEHINVVRTLQKSRTGPRDFMAVLGDAANRVNGLYLLSVGPQNGRISIHGQSDNADAVADFITALESIDSFSDIELRNVFEDDQSTRVSFKFDLDCLYKPPVELAASTLPASPSGIPGRPPGR